MAKRILIRRDTTANWEGVNPVLASGEFGVEIKTNGQRSVKVGDGTKNWLQLPYTINDAVERSELASHENATTVHGASDTPVASRIAMYGPTSGLKSDKIPAESNDVARKAELDALVSDTSSISGELETHKNDTSNPHAVTAAQVGLGNVDNTSDVNKPVSTAQTAAINTVQGNLNNHENDTSNPHVVTAAQVGAYTEVQTNQKIADAMLNSFVREFQGEQGTGTEVLTDPASTPSLAGSLGDFCFTLSWDGTSKWLLVCWEYVSSGWEINNVLPPVEAMDLHWVAVKQGNEVQGLYVIGVSDTVSPLPSFEPIGANMADYRTWEEQDDIDETKVDKIDGKELSTNDYTDDDKAIVDGVETVLATKVDKQQGITNAGKAMVIGVDGLLTPGEVAQLVSSPAQGDITIRQNGTMFVNPTQWRVVTDWQTKLGYDSVNSVFKPGTNDYDFRCRVNDAAQLIKFNFWSGPAAPFSNQGNQMPTSPFLKLDNLNDYVQSGYESSEVFIGNTTAGMTAFMLIAWGTSHHSGISNLYTITNGQYIYGAIMVPLKPGAPLL
jgi:hypothetical protein